MYAVSDAINARKILFFLFAIYLNEKEHPFHGAAGLTTAWDDDRVDTNSIT